MNARAWIAARRSKERTAASIAVKQNLVVVKANLVDAKMQYVELEGDGARAGGPFILDLGHGSGGPGRGGGGAETACAVRRK